MKNTLFFIMFFGAVFLVSTCNTNATEPITGAFGMKLGDSFEPSSAIGETSLTSGTPVYQFNPKKPFRSFTHYYVLITPKTKKVYGIWGRGNIESDPKCKKEQAVVMELLSKKYGDPQKEGLLSGLYDIKTISQGDKRVVTKCSGFTDTTIEIRYYDDELETLAEKERIQLEASKADSSGL